jgi:hypothetical protein
MCCVRKGRHEKNDDESGGGDDREDLKSARPCAGRTVVKKHERFFFSKNSIWAHHKKCGVFFVRFFFFSPSPAVTYFRVLVTDIERSPKNPLSRGELKNRGGRLPKPGNQVTAGRLFVTKRFWAFRNKGSSKTQLKKIARKSPQLPKKALTHQGAPKKQKKGRVGRLFLRGIAFFWPPRPPSPLHSAVAVVVLP